MSPEKMILLARFLINNNPYLIGYFAVVSLLLQRWEAFAFTLVAVAFAVVMKVALKDKL